MRLPVDCAIEAGAGHDTLLSLTCVTGSHKSFVRQSLSTRRFGKLPILRAVQLGANAEALNLLIEAYPKSLQSTDDGG